MNTREKYIHTRLMELDLTAETRPLEEIEKAEERRLTEELEDILSNKD